jgi:two-component system response regulator
MISSSVADILFVEDNPFDIELTLRKLKKLGLASRVRVARDGKDALDYIFRAGAHQGRSPSEDPKLVLLDLKLPKVTGLQVLQWIRADAHTKELPVIVLTGTENDREIVEIFKLGVSGYLVKPLDSEEFCKVAGGLISGLPDQSERSSSKSPPAP